jgi:hypothetical protein
VLYLLLLELVPVKEGRASIISPGGDVEQRESAYAQATSSEREPLLIPAPAASSASTSSAEAKLSVSPRMARSPIM